MSNTESSPKKPAANVVLWAAFALTSVGTGLFHLLQLHSSLGRDALLAGAALFVRTALCASVGLLAETLLAQARGGYLVQNKRRRSVLHLFFVLVMLLCVATIIDVFLFGFVGYHVTTAVRILFSDGVSGLAKVIDAAGLSALALSGIGIGIVSATGAAIWLSKLSRRASVRVGLVVPRRFAFQASLVALALFVGEQVASFELRNPYLWEQETRRMPLAFAIVRPEATLASFHVTLSLPPPNAERLAAMPALRPAALPDIYLFVIESLRRDNVSAAVMPRLTQLAESGWSFEHVFTAGNVTQYAWYGLLCSEYPLYFDVAKKNAAYQGSLPLALLRRMGYRVHLFATPDTAYQNLEEVVFGKDGQLLDYKLHPREERAPDRDRLVMSELVRVIREEPEGGRLFIVALDSTHFDYGWGEGFSPPFQPYAKDTSPLRLEADPHARVLLLNRYRDAAAWVDTQLGRALRALGDSGGLERAMVVVTGDHGESFWEHGTATHGSELSAEQLEVAFALKLPGEPPRRFPGSFSLLDVMPTLLARLDPSAAREGLFAGRPFSGDPARSRASLSFQGWSARAFRFALSYDDKRALFELDEPDPLRAQRLALKDLTDLEDRSRVRTDDDTRAYREFLEELPRVMAELPFLRF